MFEFLFGKRKRPVCKRKKLKPLPRKKSKSKSRKGPKKVSSKDIIAKSMIAAQQAATMGGSPKEQAEAASAVAADAAESKGASPEQVLKVAAEVASEVAATAGGNPEQAFENASASVVEAISQDTGDIFVDASSVMEEMEAKGATLEEITAVEETIDPSKPVSVKEMVKKMNKAAPGQQWGYKVLNSVVGVAGNVIGSAGSMVIPKKKYGPPPKPPTWGWDALQKVKDTGSGLIQKTADSVYGVSSFLGNPQNAGPGEPLMLFGRRRKCRTCHRVSFGTCGCNKKAFAFGSRCSRVPNTYQDCTLRRTPSGMYPCYQTKSGCRKRHDSKSRHSVYMISKSKSNIVRSVLSSGMALGASPSQFGRYLGVSFGRKRSKVSKSLIKQCRKLKIKTTKKVGSRRVPKSTKDLKKQIARKLRHKKM
jgi:hypothetical protein